MLQAIILQVLTTVVLGHSMNAQCFKYSAITFFNDNITRSFGNGFTLMEKSLLMLPNQT
jgi:hypothetical protein